MRGSATRGPRSARRGPGPRGHRSASGPHADGSPSPGRRTRGGPGNSASLTIGARRRPASRPSRRRCFFASRQVEPETAVISASAERRLPHPGDGVLRVVGGLAAVPPERRRRRRRRGGAALAGALVGPAVVVAEPASAGLLATTVSDPADSSARRRCGPRHRHPSPGVRPPAATGAPPAPALGAGLGNHPRTRARRRPQARRRLFRVGVSDVSPATTCSSSSAGSAGSSDAGAGLRGG